LREHYRRKREHYGLDHPDFYDSDLRNLFSDSPEYAKNLPAARFVRKIRKDVRGRVASFTDSYQYTIDQLLEKVIERCRELNLLEGFDDVTIFDQNVVSHLELLKLPYTGCNPRGLLMARDKSLSKKLLAYHRIAVPEFEVCRIGRPIRRHKRLTFPLIVKSLTQEASIGISQASVVDTDEKLNERVTFIHESIGTAAIVEQYIEGRELYVGV